MASSGYNENNSLIGSCNDKSIRRSHLIEHEEIIKNDQMASSKKLSDSNDEEIANLNDNDLKRLLDEAMNYKNPHDIVNKSETFKRLLQNVTEEDERKRKFESDSLRWKAQSNSLQNLLDDSHYQLPQSHSQISSKKHQQRRKNSTSVSTRRLEGGSLPVDMHHSSVVQSPPDQPFLSELKNNKKRKEKQQQQQQLQQQQQAKDTVIDMDMETDDRNKNFVKCLDSSSKDTSSYSDTPMIEMKYLPNRSNINDIEVVERESSSSKFTIANNTPNTITSMASIGSPIPSIIPSKTSNNAITNSVDSLIHFPQFVEKPRAYQQAQMTNTIYAPSSTINHSNNIVLTGGDSNLGASSSSGYNKLLNEQPIQLPSGPATNSILDPKYSYANKYKGGGQMRDDVSSINQTSSSSSSSILPVSHSSSNNVSSKESKNNKKRTAKSERNVKNVDVKSIEGYRGDDDVEKLLDYIEGQNQENKNQKHPKNGIVSNTSEQKLLSAEEKKKKLAKNKEKVNKLKKSNSMDELCSTNRQKETQAAEAEAAAAESAATANKIVYDVTLRSKSSNLTSGAKKEKSSDKIQSKRNERRSWGTEGLWPDTLSASTSSCLQTAKDNQDEQQEINETSSSSSSSGVQLDFGDAVNLTNFESINASNEAEKFQVVSKKRKVKRKSNEAPEVTSSSNSSKQNSFHMPALRRDGNNLRSGTKYTSNENSRNDSNIKSNNIKNQKPMSQDAKQMNANKSRRKSTSSMPPSDGEDGEYSDGGDSVQSLPIENTKSLLSTTTTTAPHTSAENSGKSKKLASSNPLQISPSSQLPPPPQQQQQQQKTTTFSYADIAKTNTNRTNNNVIAASTEKWPSISSSSLSHQNNSTNAIDPFAISNFDAINNNNNNSSLNVNNVATVVAVSINNQKQQQSHYKSTPTIISTSMMSFPDLVESNNNRNKQLSNSPLEIPQMASSNGDGTQTENKTTLNNGFERGTVVTTGGSFDNNNNSSTITSNSSNADDRINNNSQKISYSQSLLENYTEIDSNGNNSKLEASLTNTVIISQSSKNVLTKSKSVDHNNLSSIEHYPALEKTKQTLSDVLSKPIETLSNKIKTKQQQQQQQPTSNIVKEDNSNINNCALMSINNVNINSISPTSAVIISSGITTNAVNSKRGKKDKLALKKSTSTVSTSTAIINMQKPQQHNQQFSTQNAVNHHHHQQQQRPAVIILNDDNEKSNDFELGITFGFDINEHLLFGHQNGDADHPSVEMNINNNSNCDIMNTNLSSNNININNLTNQSCGFEIYENFVASPQSGVVIIEHSHQLIHQPAIIQSSSPKTNNISTNIASTSTNQNQDCVNTATVATNTVLDSSNDLGYLSSSMQTNSTTPPANNQKVATEILPPSELLQQQSDNKVDKQQTQNTSKDIKQHTKHEEIKMLTLPRFISPEPCVKNFNYDELVTFVSEEWTKVMNNGVIFNGLQMI